MTNTGLLPKGQLLDLNDEDWRLGLDMALMSALILARVLSARESRISRSERSRFSECVHVLCNPLIASNSHWRRLGAQTPAIAEIAPVWLLQIAPQVLVEDRLAHPKLLKLRFLLDDYNALFRIQPNPISRSYPLHWILIWVIDHWDLNLV